jgi:glycosyltransferase involved in cell wall biosynthesis
LTNKKILWIVAAIEDIGGGERLLFEGLNYYQKNNIDVKVITWRLSEKAFFDGGYSFDNIELLDVNNNTSRDNIFSFAFNRAKSFLQLYKVAKKYNPDLILCQSEYDAIFAGTLAKILNKQYSVLIFGQTYQFSWDWVKYTFLWKKHLKEIVNSCQGYKDVIPLTPPNIKFKNRVMIEFLSLIRYYFIRNAHNTYTLSSQVKWECEKVYKINPKVLRAGFSNTVLDQRVGLFKNKVNDKSIINFVMLSRLVKKKRVDVAIKSFQNIKLSRKWHLTIIGGGAEFENLTRLTKSLNLQDNVTLTGRVTDDILHKKLSESDVFISMDVGDFDITVVEAMSFGLYVVVSSDYVLDDEFSQYQSIVSVKPQKEQLRDLIELKEEFFLKRKPNFKALENLTWEHYFLTIIQDIE